MSSTIQELESRITNIESKIEIIMAMINHINNNMAINVIGQIEEEINQAVDKKINYIQKNKKKSVGDGDSKK
jgi:hypothetical protein